MVGCLKTCGLLGALLTTLVVCQASDNYECDVSLPELKEPPQPEICEMALYKLSFDFKLKEDDDQKLHTYSNKTMKYDIKIRPDVDRTDTEYLVATKVFTGFPSKDKPLYFMANHSSIVRKIIIYISQNNTEEELTFVTENQYEVSLTNHLNGFVHTEKGRETLVVSQTRWNTIKFDQSSKEMMSEDQVRYPRCLVFATNSVKPDVIYGGCINEMGFLFGSNICLHRESGLEFTIRTIYPTSADSHLCPNLVEVPPTCNQSVIESAKKNAQYQMLEPLKPTTEPNSPKPTTTDLNSSKPATNETGPNTTNDGTTNGTTTPPAAPTTVTCKPEPGAPIGLIVALGLFVGLMLVAIGVAVFLFLKYRATSAKVKELEADVTALEIEKARVKVMVEACREYHCGGNASEVTGKDGDKSQKEAKKDTDSDSLLGTPPPPLSPEEQAAFMAKDKPSEAKEGDKPNEGDKPPVAV